MEKKIKHRLTYTDFLECATPRRVHEMYNNIPTRNNVM